MAMSPEHPQVSGGLCQGRCSIQSWRRRKGFCMWSELLHLLPRVSGPSPARGACCPGWATRAPQLTVPARDLLAINRKSWQKGKKNQVSRLWVQWPSCSATQPRCLTPLSRQAWFPQEPFLSESAREPSYEPWERPLTRESSALPTALQPTRSAQRKRDVGAEVGSNQDVSPWSELPP